MTLLFRVDVSPAIGSGHFMRCLALAQGWIRAGGQCVFLSKACPVALEERLNKNKISLIPVSGRLNEDMEVIRETVGRYADIIWMIIDGYHFEANYQEAVKVIGLRVAFLDDSGGVPHFPADLIINQNAYAHPDMYPARELFTSLMGSRYALLRQEFISWRGYQREFAEQGRRILVTFGGSDPAGMTQVVIDSLEKFSDWDVTVIVGPQNTRAIKERSNLRVLHGVDDMPALMAECDVAVTAAGSTCWEFAFLQTPMICVAVADNQRPVADALAEHGAGINLGWFADLTPVALAEAASNLMADRKRRISMGEAGLALVDGCGAERVVARLLASQIKLRSAQESDSSQIWNWANDSVVRQASFDPAAIAWEDHSVWFSERLQDVNCTFYLAELDGPVGLVRFALQSETEAVISVNLAPESRGRGLGAALILAGCERFLRNSPVETIRAFIKQTNLASLKSFDRAGFKRIEDSETSNQVAAQFVMERADV